MSEGRLLCGSQIVIPFPGASFLIVIIPNKFSDKYWCPHRTCSFSAQSLCSCRSPPGNTGPLRKTPSFTDASPTVFFSIFHPPTPSPFLQRYLLPLGPIPVSYLVPRLGWGYGLRIRKWARSNVRRLPPRRRSDCVAKISLVLGIDVIWESTYLNLTIM